jgi:TonB family protein
MATACGQRMRFRLPFPTSVPSESEPEAVRLRRALVGSVALHVGLALALLVGAFWWRQRPDESPVFTLVAVPDQPGPANPSAEASTDLLAAMRQRQRAEERRAQREIAQERRREERERVAAEAAAAAAERARERQSAQTQTPRVVAPSTPRTSEAATSAAEASALEGYFSTLVVRLREAHLLPAGLSDLLSAEVRFTLTAGGEISGVRITRSSGNAEFDRSVLEAFARVRMPPRPDRKTDEVRLTFRIREQ